MDAYALSFPSYRSETVFLKEITSIELPHWLVRAFATRLADGRRVYDLIGDIHSHAEELEKLLVHLGYSRSDTGTAP